MTLRTTRTRLAASARRVLGAAVVAAVLLTAFGAAARPAAAGGCNDSDYDGDWLTCIEEYYDYGTDPNIWDTDGAGDGEEVYYGSNPLDPWCVPSGCG
jgi:hypothetical protein